ncbi:uncharacterized protein [Porites lutea]|uniref:uncharacterized protein n=1 Tax=Porites lutea TaxID=51062 RepID=UPI003CC5F46B
MEFKMFLLSFAVLIVATSAASESVYKYKLKIKDGDKVIEEDIEIDTEKQTETYHIPKKYSGNGGEVDIVYDFKQNLTMHRISSAKSCFLSKFDEVMPNPSDLVKFLDQHIRSTVIAEGSADSRFGACAKRGDGWMVMYKYITGLEVTDESSVKNSIEWCEVSGDLTRSVELKVILNSASNSTI